MGANTHDVRALRSALLDVDAMASGALLSIETLAKLALGRLESPSAYQSMDWLAVVLEDIAMRAFDTRNCIGCEAERCGCNFDDEAKRLRLAAEREARNPNQLPVATACQESEG